MCATSVDVAAQNAPALKRLSELVAQPGSWPFMYDAIVVPGFTPLDAPAPSPLLHPTAAARLNAAMAHFRGGAAPLIVVSGANVHPEGTPYVEAMLMKAYLLEHGFPEDQIIVEPCARHSHTNLRDVGRFMLRFGLHKAVIVTSHDQAFYFGNPKTSSFDARCIADLGYCVGTFQSLPEDTVEFRPVLEDFNRGKDPLDP